MSVANLNSAVRLVVGGCRSRLRLLLLSALLLTVSGLVLAMSEPAAPESAVADSGFTANSAWDIASCSGDEPCGTMCIKSVCTACTCCWHTHRCYGSHTHCVPGIPPYCYTHCDHVPCKNNCSECQSGGLPGQHSYDNAGPLNPSGQIPYHGDGPATQLNKAECAHCDNRSCYYSNDGDDNNNCACGNARCTDRFADVDFSCEPCVSWRWKVEGRPSYRSYQDWLGRVMHFDEYISSVQRNETEYTKRYEENWSLFLGGRPWAGYGLRDDTLGTDQYRGTVIDLDSALSGDTTATGFTVTRRLYDDWGGDDRRTVGSGSVDPTPVFRLPSASVWAGQAQPSRYLGPPQAHLACVQGQFEGGGGSSYLGRYAPDPRDRDGSPGLPGTPTPLEGYPWTDSWPTPTSQLSSSDLMTRTVTPPPTPDLEWGTITPGQTSPIPTCGSESPSDCVVAFDGFPDQPHTVSALVQWDYFDGAHYYEVRMEGPKTGGSSYHRVYSPTSVVAYLVHDSDYKVRIRACDISGRCTDWTDIDYRSPPLPP